MMRSIFYYICGAIAIGIALILLLRGTPVKSIKEVKTPLPPEEFTAAFDHSQTNGRTVTIYFKTSIVDPSHFHFERIDTADHETDFGDGDTTIANDKKSMQRTIKIDAPSGTYRIRYKDCAKEDDCETGFFYTQIEE